MKWSLSGKLNAVGLGLALLLMGFVNFVSYRNATQLTESAQKLEHTHKVVNNLINVFATLTDAESGRRGYILFGNESELERYHRAIQSIEPKLTQLRQRLANSPSQQQRLLILESLIAQRLALFEQSINLYKQGKSTISAQTYLVAKNNNLQYEIRKIITQMQSEEEQVLEQRVSKSKASIRNRMLIEFLGTILSFAILFGVYALLYGSTF
jgi:CHASE3 domain sensor protein